MKRILPLFLALALLLTGCTAVSTTETTSQAVSQVDSPSSALESAAESASSQLESVGEVSITDSNGTQITLDTSAPRVVATYGSFAEAWLLAGGELCGVTQDALEQRDLGLPEDIAVVGTVKEPNAEEIIALEPDLCCWPATSPPRRTSGTCWKTPGSPAPSSRWTPLRTTPL